MSFFQVVVLGRSPLNICKMDSFVSEIEGLTLKKRLRGGLKVKEVYKTILASAHVGAFLTGGHLLMMRFGKISADWV